MKRKGEGLVRHGYSRKCKRKGNRFKKYILLVCAEVAYPV